MGQFEELIPLLLSSGGSSSGGGADASPSGGGSTSSGGSLLSVIPSLSSVIQNLFGGSSSTAYQKIYQMFPAGNNATTLKSAITGAYAHYQQENFYLSPTPQNIQANVSYLC